MTSRAVVLAVVSLACTNGNASEMPDAPGVEPRLPNEVSLRSVGPDLAALIIWTPGTTDSITFSASRAGAPVAQMSGVPVFTGVDTLFLGARPAPGNTFTYSFRAEGTFADAGSRTGFNQEIGTISYTEPQPPGVPPSFSPPTIDSTGGGSATGPGDPIGIFVLFTDEQVQAMDTLPSCKAAQITACVSDMGAAGVIDTTIAWPKWACGVYAGYDSTGWASFKSVAGPDSAWNTHSCDRELAFMGYDSASVALYAVVDSITTGAWLASVGPITRWFATRF